MTISTRRRKTRLLFSLDPLRDGLDYQGNPFTLTPSGIVTGTFDRGGTTGAARATDANGVSYVPGYKSPRFHHVYDSPSGLWTPRGLLMERAIENLVTGSENFTGTGWSAVGTPTRTAAAHTASGVTLDLIGDDDAGSVEYYRQTVAFTADGVKAIAIHLKEGTSPAADGSQIALAGASTRLNSRITWVSGVPSVAMLTGTHLGTDPMAGGVYRILFATTAVTAADTNILQVIPVATSGQTGNVYAGGVQAVNATIPSSYIKTTSAAVTRSADVGSFVWSAAPRAMTVYVKFTETGGVGDADAGVLSIGNDGLAAANLQLRSNGTNYFIRHNPVAGAVESTAATAPTVGQVCELRGILYADGSVALGQSIDGAAEVVASASAAQAMDSAWSGPKLHLNALGTGNIGTRALASVNIAAGVQSLATLRAA